jgi:fumarate reductase subunit C
MVTRTDIKPKSVAPTDAYIDVGEMISGILLVIFIFCHLFFVSTVLFGGNGQVFTDLASWFETDLIWGISLAHLALLGVAALILVHAVLVVSRVPLRLQDQWEVLKRGSLMRHFDTILWFFQVVTGFLIFAFAFAHLWHIFTDLPIEAVKSAEGAQTGYSWFYVPFLMVLAVHLSAGFYRIMIKWNWMSRSIAVPISWFLFTFYTVVALINIIVFYKMPVGGGH